MLNQKPLKELIYLDSETTSQYPTFYDMPTRMKDLFLKKFEKEIDSIIVEKTVIANQLQTIREEQLPAVEQVYNKKAPLYAEWGKVIAISMGVVSDDYKLSLLNLADNDEKKLLSDFKSKAVKICSPTKLSEIKHTIVAYNGLVFDIPFLAKRFILNGMDIPVSLDIAGMKPWDIKHILDPKDHWKMNVWDGNTSLDLLCASFGVESSKTDMDGSMVKDVFWKDKDLNKISKYCGQDVVALVQVFLKMQNNSNQIIIKN